MAISISFTPARSTNQNPPPNSTPIFLLFSSSSSITRTQFFAPRPQPFSPLHLRREPLPNFHIRHRRFCVSSPGPPSPPPESDPDDNKSSLQLIGLAGTLNRFQDTVRIFFAVFIWMSLFFWSFAWEGWNNDKPDKGSRFRK